MTLDLETIKLISLALIGGFTPTLFWLAFWLREDKTRPEPEGMIIRTFIVGGIAVAIAFYLERFAQSDLSGISGFHWAPTDPLNLSNAAIIEVPIILLWALIEEGVKLAGVYFAAFRSRYYDEPVDAMIYMITAALGFAAIENTLFLLGSLFQNESGTYFLLTGNLRFLGATILHTVSSAVLGSFIGLTFYRSRLIKFAAIIIGLTSAVLLHSLFNFFIMVSSGELVFPAFIVLWFTAILTILFFERVKATKPPINQSSIL
jgi:RsiW-degrading membrane proteinase PrsW (M82 family)